MVVRCRGVACGDRRSRFFSSLRSRRKRRPPTDYRYFSRTLRECPISRKSRGVACAASRGQGFVSICGVTQASALQVISHRSELLDSLLRLQPESFSAALTSARAAQPFTSRASLSSACKTSRNTIIDSGPKMMASAAQSRS